MNIAQKARTVLLAEDSDDDAFFFERALAAADIPADVVRLVDGVKAVEYLNRASAQGNDLSQSHILFLDLKMPGLSGFEVLKWIRDNNLSLEVVILSGSDLEADIHAAVALGAANYIVKPVTPDDLRKRLLHEAHAWGHGCPQ